MSITDRSKFDVLNVIALEDATEKDQYGDNEFLKYSEMLSKDSNKREIFIYLTTIKKLETKIKQLEDIINKKDDEIKDINILLRDLERYKSERNSTIVTYILLNVCTLIGGIITSSDKSWFSIPIEYNQTVGIVIIFLSAVIGISLPVLQELGLFLSKFKRKPKL
jgi:hypothetical protein